MSNLPRIMRIAGWTFFTLMWIPFSLIFLNMPGGNQEYNSLSELPARMGLFLGITIVMSIIAMFLLFGSMAAGSLLERLALSRGEPGTAKILSIQPTGTRVNRYYYGMRFTLEVHSFGETFKASVERLVPMHEIPKYQIGMMVNVKYDPFSRIVAMTS